MKKFAIQFMALALAILLTLPACAATQTYTRGDANLDGELSIVDVTIMRAYIIGNITLNPEKQRVGDVNNDGGIDITDVVIMRAHIIGNYTITDTVEADPDKYPSEELSKKTFYTTEEYVKTQGRTYYYDNCTWLIQSASAVEFNFTGTYGSVEVPHTT